MGHINDRMAATCGDDLLPHHRLKNTSITTTYEVLNLRVSSLSLEEQENSRKVKEKVMKKRVDTFSNGIDLFKRFEYIDMNNLQKSDTGWSYFDKPKELELLNLISSIESIGILSPLVVKIRENGKYEIISGNSRFLALKNIYEQKREERFKYAPCFILDADIDEYFERSLIIDSNLNYRTMSQEVYIKAILEKYEILKRTKLYRNDINIAETISKEFSISQATVFNYLTLNRLCKEAITLVYEKKLKLKSARKLSKLSHENQLYILENVSLEDINATYKLKVLTRNGSASLNEIKNKIEFIKDFVPFNTSINIELNKEVLEKFFGVIFDFKDYIHTNFSNKYNEKRLKSMVKVKLDEEHMKFYVKHNFLNKEIIEKVCSRELSEVLKV